MKRLLLFDCEKMILAFSSRGTREFEQPRDRVMIDMPPEAWGCLHNLF